MRLAHRLLIWLLALQLISPFAAIAQSANVPFYPSVADFPQNALPNSVVGIDSSSGVLREFNGYVWAPLAPLLNNFSALNNPSVNNDLTEGYSVNSLWNNTSASTWYICETAAKGAAVWSQLTNGTSGGTPGGASGTLQYNNSGSFGGITIGSGLSLNSGVLTAPGSGADADAVKIGGPASNVYAQAATSGSLSDEMWVAGNWTTTGTIASTRLKVHVFGDITINYPINCQTELAGGQMFSYGSTQLNNVVGNGQGLGGAIGGFSSGNANGQNGGGGGGFGGMGGQGSNDDATMGVNIGGPAYHISQQFCGSGGGAGGCPSSGITEVPLLGGNGGGSLYLEATGNIYINANISCDGGVAQGYEVHGDLAGGGGGSGGAVEFRCKGNIVVASGVTVHANGGVGGGAEGILNPTNGGGGGGGYIRGRCSAYTNNGTVQALGGAAGRYDSSVPPAILAAAGSNGIVDIQTVIWGPPVYP